MTDTKPAPESVPQDLLRAARAALANAYVPYSHFPVGAALRSASGIVYSGANVENASYGLTRCAEQSAVQAMVTAGERDFTEIVVVSGSEVPASPCGACRQILFEFAGHARVYQVNAAGTVVASTVAGLLPGGFRL